MTFKSVNEDNATPNDNTALLDEGFYDSYGNVNSRNHVTAVPAQKDLKTTTTKFVTALRIPERISSSSPSTGRKCMVLLSCWLLHLIACGYGYGMGVIFVELVREFEQPRTTTALVQSLFYSIMTGAGVLFTPSVIRYGAGPSLGLGALVCSAGFMAAAWSTDLTMLIVFVGIVSGTGMSLFYLLGFVAVSWMFGPNSGAPLVFVTIGTSTGQLLCPYLFDILLTEFGWRGTYFILSAIVLNGLIPALIFHASRKFFQTGAREMTKTTETTKTSKNVFDVTLFRDPIIMIFLFNCFILDITGLFESWFLVDVMVLKGYERSDGSFMMVLVGIGSTVARILSIGLKLLFKIPTVAHWLYVCILIAACHAVVVSMSDYWSLFTASLVYGFAFGVVYAQVPVIMLEVSGVQRYPRAVGLLNLTLGLADFLCGIVSGLVNDLTGSYDLLLYIATWVALYVAVASIILAICVYRAQRTSRAAEYQPEEKNPLISKHVNGLEDKKCLSLYNSFKKAVK